MLKTVYDKKEDIPEKYQELYTERDGKWELTGISGVKTEADVNRLQTSLSNERTEHKRINKELKDKLQGYEALGTLEDVTTKIDKIPELEARATGQIDEKKIEELVATRVTREKAPLERKINELTGRLEESTAKNLEYAGKEVKRTIRDKIQMAATEAKVRTTALDDILVIGEGLFQVEEDGRVLTKANAMDPKAWLADMQAKKPHWWPPSEGGGAGGGDGGTGVANPWSASNWSLTEQGKYVKKHGIERATKMAESVGSKIGATGPPASK